MKRWHLYIMALMMCACSEPITDGNLPEQPEPEAPENTDDVVLTCADMSCARGCCHGKCVDLSSDTQNCGRCGVRCEDAYCLNGQCVLACEGESAKICEGVCVDVNSHSLHCGRCGQECAPNMICEGGSCKCSEDFSDCDGNAANGCESPVPMCLCTDGDVFECYEYHRGGTPGVGICRAGLMYCTDGMVGACEGYIGPALEIPGNGIDENCNGEVDERIDADGDGYYYGAGPNGDCCDSKVHCPVEDPRLVNPGATETVGNGIDDDCDGMIDEDESVLCSTEAYRFASGRQLSPSDAVLLARAMDICTDATETSGSGLIRAELLLADGSPLPATGQASVCGNKTLISPAEQVAVLTDLGGIVHALNGTMAVLSSGKAMGRENTGRTDCSGTESDAPAAFLSAHGGYLPVSQACADGSKHKKANDSVMLRLKLRAPSNAKGFKYRFKFFSKEYPRYLCNSYNDFFLAQTDASSSEIPADRNVSFDIQKNPVSVNNAFFTECDREACLTVQEGKNPSLCTPCSGGSANVAAYVDNVSTAGATEWLQTSVPVQPDEVFTLDLIIFDAGDRGNRSNGWGHLQDSLVLIDKFEWTSEATSLRTEVN